MSDGYEFKGKLFELNTRNAPPNFGKCIDDPFTKREFETISRGRILVGFANNWIRRSKYGSKRDKNCQLLFKKKMTPALAVVEPYKPKPYTDIMTFVHGNLKIVGSWSRRLQD